MLFIALVSLICLVIPVRGGSYNSTYQNLTSFANSSSPFKYTNVDNSNNFQVRGITLGGWLLLEPYITPSLFELANNKSDKVIRDEYHFCEYLGDDAEELLHQHWSTWINETDFENIKNYGFNLVRIPIGYWAFETLKDDPYVKGAQDYLDKAIEWSYNNGLKVWIDLHGAPGSQNGFDNSGLFLNNTPGWQDEQENIDLTALVLQQIYSKYGGAEFTEMYNGTILGIEVLNEPLGGSLSMDDLESFYKQSYYDARIYQDVNNTIVFHDAFQGADYWNDFLSSRGNSTSSRLNNYNIMIDHHHYEVFTLYQLNLTIAQHISNIQDYSEGIKKELKHHPAVVGEWSAALTDCTPYLNSIGYGTRWQGTWPYENDPINNTAYGTCADINDWSTWTKKHKVDTRKFVEIQLDQYENNTLGWIFWCYKTENTIEWDFVRLTELGLFPQPFSDRKYILNGTDTKPDSKGSKHTFNIVLILVAVGCLLL